VDEYHNLLDFASSASSGNAVDNDDAFNEEDLGRLRRENALDDRMKEVKSNYDRLHRLSTNQQPDEDFSERKTQGKEDRQSVSISRDS